MGRVDGGLYSAEVLMSSSPASAKSLAVHFLEVRMSGVADDSWYSCSLHDSEVQAALGMMSSVDTCVQENRIADLLGCLELVEKEVRS